MATTNDSSHSDSSTQGPRYRSAFNRLLDIIRAVSPEDFAPVNLDVMASVRTTEGVLSKIAGLKPEIAKLLVQFPMELFEQLEDRALALGHAQTVYESTRHPPAILQSLSRAASSAHGIALSKKKPAVKEPVVTPPAANNQPVQPAVVTAAVQPTAETKPEAPAPAKPVDQATLENGPFMR